MPAHTGRARTHRERVEMRRPEHADDAPVVLSVPRDQAPVRIGAGIEPSRRSLVDHDDALARRVILLCERPPAQEWNPERTLELRPIHGDPDIRIARSLIAAATSATQRPSASSSSSIERVMLPPIVEACPPRAWIAVAEPTYVAALTPPARDADDRVRGACPHAIRRRLLSRLDSGDRCGSCRSTRENPPKPDSSGRVR